MNKTRRGFLGALAAMVAAPVVAEVDTDRLLWVPGAKLISIPKPTIPTSFLSPDWITYDILKVLHDKIQVERLLNAEYDKDFIFLSGKTWPEGTQMARSYMPINRIGDTITIRKPQRFCS